ncbi:MAG: GUN4 domain-containing protein [Leptolyngbyaceae cyanobacterium SM2_5_2]|nr:GUN4 domain-containing protein [Leptolyngbyaceae cyanobacterium SM2_5_2]
MAGWGGLGLAGLWGTRWVVPQLLTLQTTSSPPDADNPDADNARNPDADNTWDTETAGAGTVSAPDLRPLEDLLQAEQWEAADQETLAIFQAVLAADADGWMDADGFVDFPCATLQRIDQLWSRASNGKFGFNTQRQIFIDAYDGTSGDDIDQPTFLCFLEQVGWRKVWETNDSLQVVYSLDAPAGHLPWKAICTGSDYCDASLNELQWYAALLRQLERCG